MAVEDRYVAYDVSVFLPNDNSERMILDLHEVTLVHADVIRFLSTSEEEGITLVRCPPYLREWIQRERAEGETQSDEE